jgi:antitoxin component of RelBE/YafQ-DinJ toxin-antitoxin module
MAATSLKLPDDLKARAAAAAERLGITTHAFMVDAIRLAAKAADERARFVAEAQAARRQMLKTGQGFDVDQVHAYLRRRVAGKAGPKPKASPWRD